MKQPELGKKISELRKAKGLTQEELVEKCNISVRTIQRIETGEVTPRSFTVKTILAALDYNLDSIAGPDSKPEKPVAPWLKNLLLTDIDINNSSGFLIKQLQVACLFGIIYFILSFLEGPVEYWRFKENEIITGIPAYVLLKIVMLVAFIFFQRGLYIIGNLFNNYLLKITSLLVAGAYVLLISYDLFSIGNNAIEQEFVIFGASLLYGVIGIVYGVSLKKLEKSVGRLAAYASFFEIAAACLFLTVVFSFLGFIIKIPAELIEIIIIFKAIEIIRSKETESHLTEL